MRPKPVSYYCASAFAKVASHGKPQPQRVLCFTYFIEKRWKAKLRSPQNCHRPHPGVLANPLPQHTLSPRETQSQPSQEPGSAAPTLKIRVWNSAGWGGNILFSQMQSKFHRISRPEDMKTSKPPLPDTQKYIAKSCAKSCVQAWCQAALCQKCVMFPSALALLQKLTACVQCVCVCVCVWCWIVCVHGFTPCFCFLKIQLCSA